MVNKLSNEPSPYLQQHKDNPVEWYTWSNISLNLAKEQKKPILLSVGYASCHWCHVMAHESFEDNETAKLMNNYFINIKVDREERPDIDFIFQSSYQLFNQAGGGWPLTMFLDENGVPFMGGTYFPKNEQHGLPSFKNLIIKVHEAYTEQREKIISQKDLIIKSLELKKNAVLNQDLEAILDSLLNNLDEVKGGYKGAPKFPTFNVFDTLLHFYNKTKKEKYIKPVKLILKKLCSQGIYDHVEGGISRYSVDDNWLIPHFEKMLYDNAQFISLLSKYLKTVPDEYFKHKIIQTINFISVNFLNNKNDLIGSAYDADSDGVEGKYYVYHYDEIKNIEGINSFFDIQESGNWEGKIILEEKKIPSNELVKQLLRLRKKKNKPLFDSKAQLHLNCLWVSALLDAHESLPNEGYLKKAQTLFEKIELNFMKDKIFHSYDKNIVFLEDYAYLINTLLDLFNLTLNIKYKLKAKELCSETIQYFYRKDKNIFQKNKIQSNDIFFNPIDISDHTISNGNSIMLRNLSRLGFVSEAKKLNESLNGYLNIYKNYMVSSLKSIDLFNEILLKKNCNEEGCEI